MDHFIADERDVRFVLFEQLKVQDITGYERFSDFSQDDFEMILSESLKFSHEVVAPLNEAADRVGCRFENGKVFVPEEYHDAYKLFTELGWANLNIEQEYGGQGLPNSVSFAVKEYLTVACPGFGGFPMLAVGAANLIKSFGTQEMKDKYCEKMYSGQWGGTMCLTEPQAGSDVGAVKTSARRNGDHYLVSGNKLFISVAEHDLTENIIHLLLARVEGAPAGTKGLSLFVIPKILVNDDGTLGEPNDVVCTGIEHKMGLHGSPTCAMSFGENGKCVGYLVGKEGEGIRLMFHMMNEARIGVGLQGQAMASIGYLNALKYAKERIQGAAIERSREDDAPRVPIIDHPDVRRALLTMRSYAHGTRALVLWCGHLCDLLEAMPEGEEKNKTSLLLDLLTPICKAYSTDMSLKVLDLAFRIYGGYGYISEYPIEQFIRDSMVSVIYEGTSGIQALDLLGRKVAMKGGAALITFIGLVNEFIAQNKDHESLSEYIGLLEKAQKSLLDTTMFLGGLSAKGNVRQAMLFALPYLEMFGDVVNSYLLLQQAVIAHDELKNINKDNPDNEFYTGKLYTARFFTKSILPKVYSTAEMIKNADSSALDIPDEIL